jgi:hypothetical protein
MSYTAEQLADIHAIENVAKRYSRGVDRLDAECMKSAYWPDAVDDHGVFVGNAWEFVDHCMVSHLRWRSTMHCVYNHYVELIDADNARGESYNVTHLFRADADVMDTWFGRYLDRYEKREGEWRIAHRVCVHEGTTSDALNPMPIASDRFRQGSFDRPSAGRLVGP